MGGDGGNSVGYNTIQRLSVTDTSSKRKFTLQRLGSRKVKKRVGGKDYDVDMGTRRHHIADDLSDPKLGLTPKDIERIIDGFETSSPSRRNPQSRNEQYRDKNCKDSVKRNTDTFYYFEKELSTKRAVYTVGHRNIEGKDSAYTYSIKVYNKQGKRKSKKIKG